MDRTSWESLFKKRFILVPPDENARPGEATYALRDKEFTIIIRAASAPGALRAESVTVTDECLVVNRGQGRSAYVAWDKVDAISTVDK